MGVIMPWGLKSSRFNLQQMDEFILHVLSGWRPIKVAELRLEFMKFGVESGEDFTL